MNADIYSVQTKSGDWMGKTWTVLLLLALLSVVLGIMMEFSMAPVSFDGAMNLQVSQALAQSEGYARFYDTWSLFPEEVQTNAPLVIPASAVFAMFGVTFFSSQLVSILYTFMYSVVVFWLVRPVTGPRWALMAVLLCLTVTEFGRFALNGYGEVPALSWCLLGIGLSARSLEEPGQDKMILAGCCFGLAILTKTVMLMPVGVSGVVLALACLMTKEFRKLLVLFISLVCTIAVFELWRLAMLGGFLDWQLWWSDQISAVSAQAGVSDGFQDTAGLFNKIIAHGHAFSDDVHLSFPSIYGLLVAPAVGLGLLVWGLARQSVDRYAIIVIACLLAIVLAYFSWWLAITPTQKAWYRRVFNGWLVFVVLLPLLIVLAQQLRHAWLRRLSTGALCLPAALVIWSAVQSFDPSFNTNRRDGVASTVQYISNLPENSRFYGFGWFSAPVISLYSGVPVHDLISHKFRLDDHEGPHFLLVDPNLRRTGNLEYALEGIQAELVHDGGPWARIYKLDSATGFPDFEAHEILDARTVVDFGTMEYSLAQGLHPDRGIGWKWSRPQSRVLLSVADGSTALRIKGAVPDFDELIMADGDSFVVQVRLNDCQLPSISVAQGGRFQYRESIAGCELKDQSQAWVEFRSNGVRARSYRLSSWRVDYVGFE